MKIIAFHASHARSSQPHRRRRRNYRPFLVIFLLLLLIAGIGVVLAQILHSDTTDETGYPVTSVGELPVYEHYVDSEAIGRIGGTRQIKYVVINETDNFKVGANAARHDAFIHKNAHVERLSWHKNEKETLK